MPASASKAFASDVNSIFSSDAKPLLTSTLSHRSTGNSVYWPLDGDDSRPRQVHAQHNLAVLRRMAFNLLPSENSAQIGIAAKRVNEPVGTLAISRKFSSNKMRLPCRRCLNLFSVQGILFSTKETSRNRLTRNKSRDAHAPRAAATHHCLFRHFQTSQKRTLYQCLRSPTTA